jgi:hypothetical protein
MLTTSLPALVESIAGRDADDEARPRYSLANVLALIPKTKRSQIQLLIRTGRITPAWPATGTGYDHAFDRANLFEIALAAELIELGFDGGPLTRYFRSTLAIIRNPTNAPDAEYLVILPSKEGPVPWHQLVARGDLEAKVGIWTSFYLVNVRNLLSELRGAVAAFDQSRETES